MSTLSGKFCWYELMTDDPAAAKSFYGKVMGWGFEDAAGLPGVRYTRLTAGGTPMGGMVGIPDEACREGARPVWMGYIQVDDVDSRVSQIQRAGGKVHKAPADIPAVGRFAIMSDPQGAHFVLFKPAEGATRDHVPFMTPGHGAWHELHAADSRATFDFYAEMFGWTRGEAFDMGPAGTYQLFATGENPVGGITSRNEASQVPSWLYYFAAENIDAAVKRVTDAGGRILVGPAEVPGGAWIIQCLDPQGAMFAIVAPPGRA